MYGMIGEDESDIDTLKVIVRRLAANDRLPIKAKGYSGCAEMRRKGARQLQAFRADVEKSATSGPRPGGTGRPQARGFVPKIRSRPPYGATEPPGPAPDAKISAINPAAAICSA